MNLIDTINFEQFKNTSEREFLVYRLHKNNFNMMKTAKELNMQRSHIYNLVKKYRIEKTDRPLRNFPAEIFSPEAVLLPEFDLSAEYWAAYPKNPFYYVSNMGRVKTVQGDMLSISCQVHSYPIVSININGKFYAKYIYRMVAETFIPNPDNKLQVNHKNRIKYDSRLENLEWVTPSENVIHSMTTKVGEHKSAVKNDLTPTNLFS